MPLPYSASKPQEIMPYWDVYSELRGFLSMFDPTYVKDHDENFMIRIKELFSIPEINLAYEFMDHPINLAYLVAFDHQVLNCIRDNRIHKKVDDDLNDRLPPLQKISNNDSNKHADVNDDDDDDGISNLIDPKILVNPSLLVKAKDIVIASLKQPNDDSDDDVPDLIDPVLSMNPLLSIKSGSSARGLEQIYMHNLMFHMVDDDDSLHEDLVIIDDFEDDSKEDFDILKN